MLHACRGPLDSRCCTRTSAPFPLPAGHFPLPLPTGCSLANDALPSLLSLTSGLLHSNDCECLDHLLTPSLPEVRCIAAQASCPCHLALISGPVDRRYCTRILTPY